MEAKELRIGNYVNFLFHKDSGGIKKIEVFMSDIENLIHGGNRSKYYEPIPLTEEWLVKFGFELEDEKIYYHLDSYEDIYITKTSYSFSIYNATHFTNIKQGIKHVHQLQNLYFALTNEELTIK